MATTTENRVVEMRLDNSNFERNAGTTLSTLEKLSNAMNFSKVAKTSEQSANTIQTTLSSVADSVNQRFSAMEVAAITAISNITNSAVNMAKNLLSSLTIKPIMTGFQEYETQINATQTILANTRKEGATIETVNAALDQLNKYADLTIYNFTEMTRNIGTFTAAGVDLKTSVDAIQGIANLAAVSGSTSQQASVAMYQLSQALATGTVRLMDWNSVVNAGMGGQTFQDALMETARIHGIAVDQMIEEEGSFRDSLQKGWLSAEIMTETLKKFTTSGVNEYLSEHSDLTLEDVSAMRESARSASDQKEAFREMAKAIAESSDLTEDQIFEMIDLSETAENAATKVKTFTQLISVLQEAAQSGWSASWRIIVGDFEEAEALLTRVSTELTNIINGFSDARNAVLTEWKDLGGRTDIIDGIKNIYDNIMKIAGAIKSAFDNVFPPLTGSKLASISEGFKNLTERIKITDESADKIRRTIEGVLSIFKLLVDSVKPLFTLIDPAISLLMTGVELLLTITAKAGDAFSGVNQYISNLLNSINECIKSATSFGDAFSKAAEKLNVFRIFSDIFESLKNNVAAIGSGLFDKIGSLFDGLSKFNISDVAQGLSSLLGILGSVSVIKIAKSFVDSFGSILNVVKSVISFLGNKSLIGGTINTIRSTISGLFSAIEDTVNSFKRNADIKAIENVAKTIAILAAAFYILAQIDPNQLSRAMATMTVVLAELLGFLKIYDSLSITKLKGLSNLILVATSVGILALALSKLASIGDNLGDAVLGMAAIFAMLVAFEKGISMIAGDSGRLAKGTASLIPLGVAITILAADLKLLSTVNWEQMGPAVVGMVAIVTALVALEFALSKISNSSGIAKSIGSLILLASAVTIIAVDFKILSTVEPDKLVPGAIGMIAVVAALSGLELALSKISNSSGIAKGMGSLILLATAVSIISIDFAALSSLQWDAIARGATGLMVVITELSLVALAMSKIGPVKGVGSLIVLSTVVSIISADFISLANTSWESIARGATGLLAVITELGLLTFALSKIGSVKGVGSLLAISAAITILSVDLKLLSTMPVDSAMRVVSQLVTIVGSLTGLYAVMGAINTKGSGIAMLEMAAAITILSASLISLSKLDWNSLLIGFAAIGGLMVVVAGGSAILAPFSAQILALSKSFAVFGAATALLGVGVLALGGGLLALAAGASSIAASGEILVKALEVILQVVMDSADMLAKTLFTLLHSIIEGLRTEIPYLVDSFVAIFVEVFRILATKVDEIVAVAVDFLNELFKAIDEAIQTLDFKGLGETLIAATVALASAVGLMKVAALLKTSVKDAAVGIAKAALILAEIAALIAAFGLLYKIPYFNEFIQNGGKILESIGAAIGSLIGGLAGGIAGSFMETYAASMPLVATYMSEFAENLQPFIAIVSTISPDVVTSAETLADAILTLATANFLEGVARLINQFTGGGLDVFGKQLVEFADYISQFVTAVKGKFDDDAIASVAAMTQAVADLVNILPTMGGLKGLISGSYSELGEQLITLVNYLSTFADEMTEIDPDRFSNAVATVQQMVDVISQIGAIDQGSVNAFVISLSTIGQLSLESMAQGFSDYQDYAISTINGIIQAIMDNIISLVQANSEIMTTTFKDYAKNIINAFIVEFNSGSTRLILDVSNAIKKTVDSLRSYYQEFHDVGEYLAEGISDGILSGKYLVVNSAQVIASAALQAAKDTLAEKSPSKKGHEIGAFFSIGFVNGILSEVRDAESAGITVADRAKEGLSGAISKVVDGLGDMIDMNPVIRPTLDLSDVQSKSGTLSAMFSRRTAMSIDASMRTNRVSENQNGVIAGGSVYNFTQNNYSPKALSRIDIYRQTKNQFSQLKGLA